MKLPNAEAARIDRDKLRRYLLSETHPIGRWKARFFRGIGFDESNVTLFERSLIEIAETEEVVETLTTLHGTKYVIEGLVRAPSGNLVRLRTVWIVDTGQDRPRFVTAYPI
jgi:hypothetical protein